MKSLTVKQIYAKYFIFYAEYFIYASLCARYKLISINTRISYYYILHFISVANNSLILIDNDGCNLH